LDPLIRKMQEEKRSNKALRNYLKALRELALNPCHLRDFTGLVLNGEYLQNDFLVSGVIFS